MIKSVFFSLLFINFFIISCTTDKTTEFSEKKVKIEFKNQQISIDSLRLPMYYRFFLFENNNDELIYAYNKHTHSIDIFNLTELQFKNSIPLDYQGPNGIALVKDLFVKSVDSIFLYTRGNIILINSNGNKINKIDLFKNNDYNKYGELAITPNFRLEYDRNQNCIYLCNLYPETDWENKALITKYEIPAKKYTQLPIYHLNYYKPNQTGFLSYLNKSYTTDSLLIYNFEYAPEIFVYNKVSKKINSYAVKSKYSNNKIKLITKKDPELWQRHTIENTKFLPVIFDKYRNVYYRFHWGNISYKRSDDKFNSFIDKPLYLMILSRNFKVIKEIELPPRRYNLFSWAIVKEGILLMNNHPMFEDADNNYLKFDIINIKIL